MATKEFLVNLDLKQNQLVNATLEKRKKHPKNPVVAQIYYNTKTSDVYIFTGKIWISLTKTYTIENNGK